MEGIILCFVFDTALKIKLKIKDFSTELYFRLAESFDSPASVFKSGGIIALCHHIWLMRRFLEAEVY